MRAHSPGKRAESSLVAEVQKLGHYPRRFHKPTTAAQLAEDNLFQRLVRARKAKRLTPAEDAELEELMMWMQQREIEWSKMQRQFLREERATQRRRQRAVQRKKKLRRLLSQLAISQERCDCYDFAQWQWLWRRNLELARRLRDAGHHLVTCKLVRRSTSILEGWSYERGETSPEIYDKDSEDMVSDEEFEYAGLVGWLNIYEGILPQSFFTKACVQSNAFPSRLHVV